MPIATPDQFKQMLDSAQNSNYAYPAINCTSILTLNAAMKGFAESKSDGIIQVSTGGGEFASGTSVKDAAFGAIVLHADPEAAMGGPLALVQSGDMIHLDVPNRSLTLDVDDAEMERRRSNWTPPPASGEERGYNKLFMDHVNQAGEGVDFDFLTRRPFTENTP